MKRVLLALPFALLSQVATAQTISLANPVQCNVGKDCFIQNYVDQDTTGGYKDYRCGSLSYDKHTGTDIRVPNITAMNRGVAVVAAAEGTVRGVRDNMQDVSIKSTGRDAVKSRECGNGVVINHPAGYETQYCHMRSGSIIVKQGEKVRAGQKLGLIGLSGATEFPHLHFEVRRLGRVFDPFTGEPAGTPCGSERNGLWNAAVEQLFAYQASAVLGAGFYPAPPKPEQVRSLAAPVTEIPRNAPAIVFWVDIMGPRAGDTLTLTLYAPNGQPLVTKDMPFQRNQAQNFTFIGDKATPEGLIPGEYTGKLELKRPGKAEPVLVHETKVNVPF